MEVTATPPDTAEGSTEASRHEVSGPARRLGKGLTVFTGGLGVFLAFRILGRWPGLVESGFASGWAALVLPPLSRVTGAVPVPVIELLAGSYLAYRLWTAARGGWVIFRGRRPGSSTLVSGLSVALRDVGVALLLFYGLWGFHYARAPVAERLALPAAEEVETAELQRLARELTDAANASYRALHGTEDAGVPTAMPDRWDALERALERGWRRVGDELALDPLLTARYGPPKPLMTSPLVAHLGITGVYSPFTAEALVVGSVPAVSLGLSLAHEQAHQRGVTAEGEATLLGFVAAMRSGEPLLRYSAAARAGARLVSALAARDVAAAEEVRAARLPGVRRDLSDLRAYQLRHRGAAARIATGANDAYLRANRVPGGVESYDEAAELLLRLARRRGGTLAGETTRGAGGPGEATPTTRPASPD